MAPDLDQNVKPERSSEGEKGTITRIIGIKMPNGRMVEFPVEYWIAGILSILHPNELNSVVGYMEKVMPPFAVKSLGDGMGIINKPINGIILPGR